MQALTLTTEELQKLLSCGCSDAAVLYLYRRSGQPLETALDALHFTVPQMIGATDCLRQLGLWESAERPPVQPEHPVYTEEDVRQAMRSRQGDFSKLVGEAQRRLGRTLSTEELKTLLSFVDYLRLPSEVVGILLHYCVERCRRRGVRAPSMRMIEKEAYHWADENIDNLETASYYVQQQLRLHTRIQGLRRQLQIDQRRLTMAEEQYLAAWIGMGFSDEVIHMAYERTCLNTGSLKWAYMNSILKSWHEKNLHTPRQIAEGDSAPQPQQPRRSDKMYQHHGDALTQLEKQAVARALAEGQED